VARIVNRDAESLSSAVRRLSERAKSDASLANKLEGLKEGILKTITIETRRFGYYIPQQNGTVDISVGVNVPDADVLAELNEIVSVIFKLQPIIFALDMVERNYQEILDSIKHYRSRLEDVEPGLPVDISTAMDGFLSTSQKVTNFLSSTSAFLAQTEMQLRRIHGKGSPELNSWDEKRKNLHAQCFSYRFLYELRNFAQHRNIPFSNLNIAGERPSEDLPMVFKIGVQIFRDGLLDDGYKWGKVQVEIQQQPPVLDLLPITSEYLNCLRRLCLEAVRYQDVQLAECGHYFDVMCRMLKIPDGAVPVLIIGEPTKTAPPSRYEIIPIEQYKFIIRRLVKLLNGS
jgi:hypothetical protein